MFLDKARTGIRIPLNTTVIKHALQLSILGYVHSTAIFGLSVTRFFSKWYPYTCGILIPPA